jgi:class 3 adenylate cyclase
VVWRWSGRCFRALCDDGSVTAVQPVPPSGTVTFLFTDLEGSTALWDAEPVEMAAALEVHDRVVRGSVVAHGGYVFSTAGDSFAAAFARADVALAAAEEVTAELAAVQWATSVPLRARVGAHTGEAQERDGDFFGPAVNRAARVMAAAHGGQVLVSEATAGLVGGVVGRWLGEFVLRGFVDPVGIYQLGDGQFPALRVSGGSVGNLPRPVNELVGRTGEVAELVGLARRAGLVTLVGPGGMGKTRLAIEAATELGSEVGRRVIAAKSDLARSERARCGPSPLECGTSPISGRVSRFMV